MERVTQHQGRIGSVKEPIQPENLKEAGKERVANLRFLQGPSKKRRSPCKIRVTISADGAAKNHLVSIGGCTSVLGPFHFTVVGIVVIRRHSVWARLSSFIFNTISCMSDVAYLTKTVCSDRPYEKEFCFNESTSSVLSSSLTINQRNINLFLSQRGHNVAQHLEGIVWRARFMLVIKAK